MQLDSSSLKSGKNQKGLQYAVENYLIWMK